MHWTWTCIWKQHLITRKCFGFESKFQNTFFWWIEIENRNMILEKVLAAIKKKWNCMRALHMKDGSFISWLLYRETVPKGENAFGVQVCMAAVHNLWTLCHSVYSHHWPCISVISETRFCSFEIIVVSIYPRLCIYYTKNIVTETNNTFAVGYF